METDALSLLETSGALLVALPVVALAVGATLNPLDRGRKRRSPRP